MTILEKTYRLVDSVQDPTRFDVSIIRGNYKGVVYYYDIVSWKNENTLSFVYNILNRPNHLDNLEENEEFLQLIGDILYDIMIRELLKKGPILQYAQDNQKTSNNRRIDYQESSIE